MLCVKAGIEIERPVDGYDNREVDIWDRTTWCRAKPYPVLLKNEGMFMVEGDPRPHIVEVERADGED